MKMMDMRHKSSTRLLEGSSLWHRDVEGLTPLDLQLFLRSHWGSYEYPMALSEVDAMIKAIWDEVLYGSLPELPQIAFFATPKIRITSDEFSSYLTSVSIAHRRAIIFTLETNLAPQKVAALTHEDIGLVEGLVNQIAMSAVHSQPRHPTLPYVFWQETADGKGAPLHDLADAIFDVSQGLGLQSLRQLYHNMICIDQDSDLAQFSLITQLPLSRFKTLH